MLIVGLFLEADNRGVFNEEDILTIVDVIEKGECFSVNNKYGRERKIYKYVEDEVKFTVVTDVTKNGEVFGDFYTNQKARPLNNKMANADTLDGAGVNSGNALDAAKIQNNSDISKENHQEDIYSDEFKQWFGDWEKNTRIQKLRISSPVRIKGRLIDKVGALSTTLPSNESPLVSVGNRYEIIFNSPNKFVENLKKWQTFGGLSWHN